MADLMWTPVLPEVRLFSRKPHESFKRILGFFSSEMSSVSVPDRDLIYLLEEFLRKNPLIVFETIPAYIKQSTFDEEVEIMEKRIQENSNSA